VTAAVRTAQENPLTLHFHDLDLTDLRVLLCDADGNLFPSEEPAFLASAEVTNDFLASHGVRVRLSAEELRLGTTGKNFRTTAVDLCVAYGVPVHPALAGGYPDARIAAAATDRPILTPQVLAEWVARERRQVTAYLGQVLQPDPDVRDPLGKLASHLRLAAVSSSATVRLDACFTATGLAGLIPADRRYSAEDSLPAPTSKPDPAIYLFAGAALGCAGRQGLAVEDSLPGARSAIAAGFPTVGNVMFVPQAERPARIDELRRAGVAAVVTSWHELADLLLPAAAVGSPAPGVPCRAPFPPAAAG
jgi:HAD superfamily hydrolase (TIGR01509 family)